GDCSRSADRHLQSSRFAVAVWVGGVPVLEPAIQGGDESLSGNYVTTLPPKPAAPPVRLSDNPADARVPSCVEHATRIAVPLAPAVQGASSREIGEGLPCIAVHRLRGLCARGVLLLAFACLRGAVQREKQLPCSIEARSLQQRSWGLCASPA